MNKQIDIFDKKTMKKILAAEKKYEKDEEKRLQRRMNIHLKYQ